MTIRTRTILLAAVLAPLAAAQVGRSNTVYKAEFNIRDSGDAGAKTGRRYSMVVAENQKSTFKVGSRVPVATSSSAASTQFTYVDVGVNIDCIVGERNGQTGMHADIDLSGAVGAEKNPTGNPTVSQIKLQFDAIVTPGKPTVVASFDDPVTSRKFEVEATVTKM
jgi:hypothetical protein